MRLDGPSPGSSCDSASSRRSRSLAAAGRARVVGRLAAGGDRPRRRRPGGSRPGDRPRLQERQRHCREYAGARWARTMPAPGGAVHGRGPPAAGARAGGRLYQPLRASDLRARGVYLEDAPVPAPGSFGNDAATRRGARRAARRRRRAGRGACRRAAHGRARAMPADVLALTAAATPGSAAANERRALRAAAEVDRGATGRDRAPRGRVAARCRRGQRQDLGPRRALRAGGAPRTGSRWARSSPSRSPTKRRPSCASGSAARLRELGADEAARATEGAFISTIHGFCARLLRTTLWRRESIPSSTVLDQPQAQRLGRRCLRRGARAAGSRASAGGIELIAAYTPGGLRGAVLGDLRRAALARRDRARLPPLPPAPDLEAARACGHCGCRDGRPASWVRSPSRARRWSRRSSGCERVSAVAGRRGAMARRARPGWGCPAATGRRSARRSVTELRGGARPVRGGLRARARCRSIIACWACCWSTSGARTRGASASLRARLRGPGAADPGSAGARRRAARALPGAVRPRHGGRAPGHQRECSSS